MTQIRTFLITALYLVLFCHSALALQIISPKEGEVFYAGSQIPLVVKADTVEEWEYVIYGMQTLSYDPLLKEYRTTLRIPADLIGYEKLSVIGLDKSGKETEVIRNILVKLSPNVVVQLIMVGEDLMVLYAAPSGSNMEDKQRIESGQINVAGMYSDGVKRYIASSTTGTIYTSRDEKIVTVDSEGKVRAQGIGRTKIMVRNGKYSADVKVIVKPYKK
jgi:hypothetical protein